MAGLALSSYKRLFVQRCYDIRKHHQIYHRYSKVTVPLIGHCNIQQNSHREQPHTDHHQQHRTHFTYKDGPGSFNGGGINGLYQEDQLVNVWKNRNFKERAFTVGIGGPVGSGKTALVLQLCKALYPTQQNLAVVTNDIFTQEDAEYLVRQQALPSERIRAVETGGCPHAAIREDISSNLLALEELTRMHGNNDFISSSSTSSNNNNSDSNDNNKDTSLLLLCESGGDNLAANFSRELADLTIYVIDVAGGDKVPRKGGPGITQSDLLIINKIDLAPAVGSNLDVMVNDANRMRKYKVNSTNENHHHQHVVTSRINNNKSSDDVDDPTIKFGPTFLCSIKHGVGVKEVCDFILDKKQHAYNIVNADVRTNDRGPTSTNNHGHSHHHSHHH